MLSNYTAKYTRINSGYMGQLVEWPEVITEGKTLDECREMLKDALSEMVLAYKSHPLNLLHRPWNIILLFRKIAEQIPCIFLIG